MDDVLVRPRVGEFDPFYTGYVDLIPSGVDPRNVLRDQLGELPGLMITVSEDGAEHRYSEGKWSIKEVVGHLCDTERIFGYRLLRVVRGDETPLPGFEENKYVPAGRFDARALGDVVSEWEAARHSTLALVESIDPDVLDNRTLANDAPISARALLFIVPGHTQHHLQILRARYGVGGGS
jgi:hypothetical protein